MGLVDDIRILEAIVKTPTYRVYGVTSGRLIYRSTSEGASDIWSIDLRTLEKTRLTIGGVHGVAVPSEKSPLVIYTRDVTRGREQHQVFAIDCRGGEERKLADFTPMRIFGMAFDGKRVAFTAASEKEIALYLVKPDGSFEKLYSINTIASVSDLNEKYIVGSGMLRRNPLSSELFIYSFETGEFTVYTPRNGSINKYPKLSDSRMLFETNIWGRNRLAIYDIEEEKLSEAKFSEKDYDNYNPLAHVDYGWTKDSKIWTIGSRDGRSRVFLDGKWISLPAGFVSSVALHDEKLYATHSSLMTPYRVFEVDLEKLESRVIIDNRLPENIERRFGKAYFIKYKSFDGLEIPAYVAESNIASKPGPTIVYVHGGPWAEVADYWSVMIASLVALGYHVVAPNFRGSTGYGEEFRLMDIGDPGGGDLEDVVHARKWAVELGIASKVAIMGYSYGGYMTLLATGRYPDIWQCGVAGASVIDWEEMYGLSDALFKQFIDVLFAGRRELWKERSPITYVENVNVPLCIIHPQNDSRTPLKPVLKYISKLLKLGRTFEAHIVPDIGHAIVTVEDMFKILLPAIIFLRKYLK